MSRRLRIVSSNMPGSGLAGIEIDRAARVDRIVETDIAGGNVIPRHPFEAFRNLVRIGLLCAQRFRAATTAHIMRCVWITPLGMPVEPEVNRNFATVS